jgi:hypothetical protein
MRLYYVLVLLLLLLKSGLLLGQTKQFTLAFKPVFGSKDLCLDSCFYPILGSDTIKITELKFYISKITFLQNGQEIYAEPNSFHLIDARVSNSLSLLINYTNELLFDAIKFNIGVDSITNVSGAMEGALDPTKGMYWTWQSGYINLKLEANCVNCTAKNKGIVFHLGGYQTPFNALQTKVIPVSKNNILTVKIELENLFNQVNLNQTNHLMSPSKEAVQLSLLLMNTFSVQNK